MVKDELKGKFGKIEVHTPYLLEEIFKDRSSHEFKEKCTRSASAPILHQRTQSPKYVSEQLTPPNSAPPCSATPLHGCQIQSWLNHDSIKDIQERSNLESQSIRNLYKTVLENEKSFVQDVDAYLEYRNIANRNRKAELFKKWSIHVYTPLQQEIKAEMNSYHYKMHEKKKRQQYDKYINYRNKKGMVFLDVYSSDEYDPFEVNCSRPGPLKVNVGIIDKKDPLLHQDYKRIIEDQDLIRCQTGFSVNSEKIKNYHAASGPLVPLGRHNASCQTWLQMPMHNIDSPVRLKSRQRIMNKSQHSQLDFPTWQATLSTSQLVDMELHCQKKRFYAEKYQQRAILEWPASVINKPCEISAQTITF